MPSKDANSFTELYMPKHEASLDSNKIFTIDHSIDEFPSGDIFKAFPNMAIMVDSPLSGKDADRTFGNKVLLDVTKNQNEDERATYAQIKLEDDKLYFRARGSTGIICWEKYDEDIVPTILHFASDYDPGELNEGSIHSKNIVGWMMFTDGGLDTLWKQEITGNMPGYEKYAAYTANNKIHQMQTTRNHKNILLYKLIEPITNAIKKEGFEKAATNIASNGSGNAGKSPKDDSLLVMGTIEHTEKEPALPFLFSPQIIEAQQVFSEKNETNSLPMEEFILSPDQLKYIESEMDDLKSMIGSMRYYSTGMTFDRVMPHIYDPNTHGAILAIKRSRHVSPEKVIKDTELADAKALAHGLRNIAPSYKVGDFIVQKWLLEDETISDAERTWVIEDFLSRIRRMGGSIDNALENIIVTPYGPATPDTMSIHWHD